MAHCLRLGAPAAEGRRIGTVDWPTEAERPAFAVLDCGKAEQDLALRMPDWRQSLGETVERLMKGE